MPPVAVVGCTLLLLYSCRKDVDKPCCNDDPIRPKWLLTSVLTQSFRGAGHWDIGMHRFEYNANNQLIVYKEMDYIDPAFPPTRIDSFFYDDQNRIVEIRNAGYKKIFVYGSGDRKRYNCKYLIDSRGTYWHVRRAIIGLNHAFGDLHAKRSHYLQVADFLNLFLISIKRPLVRTAV